MGTWSISPTKPSRTRRTAASSRSSVAAVATTSPSASSVVVLTPSRMVASYDFSVSIRCPSSRVARLTPSTSTPVAIGSSVPAWPDLAGAGQPAYPRDDVVRGHPARLVDDDQAGLRGHDEVVVLVGVDLARLLVGVGLAGVRRTLAGRGHGLVGLPRLGQHVVEVAGVLGQRVVDERQRRHVPHAELLADLGAEHALGRLERGRGADQVALLTEDGVEDRGLLRVSGEPDVGDGDEAEPRVLDPPLQHLGHDHLDPVRDLAHAWAGHVPSLSRVSTLTRHRIGDGSACTLVRRAGSRASRRPPRHRLP